MFKEYNHFVKSIIEELKTRNAMLILIGANVPHGEEVDTNVDINIIKMPLNKTFNGLLSVVIVQLLAYHLSIAQGINPDMPRNLAKVVTVD